MMGGWTGTASSWLILFCCCCFGGTSRTFVVAFTVSPKTKTRLSSSAVVLWGANPRSKFVAEYAAKFEEGETAGGVEGAQYFGGEKQKEGLFVPEYEDEAQLDASKDVIYRKFEDSKAFDELGGRLALSLQRQLNAILYIEESVGPEDTIITYDDGVVWESPFRSDHKEATNPMEALVLALDFYNRLDVAIVSAKQQNDHLLVKWEVSVVWPNFWEARVVATGTSDLTLNQDQTKIVRQVDKLDGDKKDLTSLLVRQIPPRFWDAYHIGMSPAAEMVPPISIEKKGLFKTYSVTTLAPRLVYRPSLLDLDTTGVQATAASLPNHAFCSIIKTMGPKRERYVTTCPVEVQLNRETVEGGGTKNRITWTIPVSVEFQTLEEYPFPEEDENTQPEQDPQTRYEYQGTRKFASLPYGGYPNDSEVVQLRKDLYELIMKDGLKPKLDDDGRPQFFFRQNNVKACYTIDGFGMVVYESRPDWSSSNEVCIELEG